MLVHPYKPALTLLFFVFTLFCSTTVSAQSWVPVGNLGSVAPEVDDGMDMALNPAGVPYVVYSDGVDTYKATVLAYIAGSWTAVGDTDFSPGDAVYPSIAIDGSGTPYVVFDNYSISPYGFQNDSIVTVMKYNGSSWVVSGAFYPAVLTGGHRSIAIDPDGIAYAVYQNPADSDKITVMKYSGIAWEPVGAPGFSAANASDANIMIGGNGIPYVVYADPDSDRVVVMKFNGTEWVSVVGGQVSVIGTYFLSANIGYDGVPYVLYYDSVRHGTSIIKYNDTAWEYVDTASLPQWALGDIAIDGNGTPYIGFPDSTRELARVMKYSGGHWTNVGNTDFSDPYIGSETMAIDSSGVPYIGYAYTTIRFDAAVMKFDQPAGLNNISVADHATFTVFPNPNNGTFIIKGTLGTSGDQEVSVEITDILGQVVYTERVMAHGGIIDQEVQLTGDFANGMYILNLTSVSSNDVFHVLIEQ